MKELMNEWRSFLKEATEYELLEPIVRKALSGADLDMSEKSKLASYVKNNESQDPVGAARVADALVVYHTQKEKEGVAGSDVSARTYQIISRRLKGLKHSNNPTIRAADYFLGISNDEILEKDLYTSTDRPLFAKAIIDLSSQFRSKVGIKILDPTQAPTVPNLPWMQKYPVTAKYLQKAADWFASDPFTLVQTLGMGANALKSLANLKSVGAVSPGLLQTIKAEMSQGIRQVIINAYVKAAELVAEKKEILAGKIIQNLAKKITEYSIDFIEYKIKEANSKS